MILKKLASALTLIVLAMGTAFAQSPTRIQQFNAWGAYSYASNKGKVCDTGLWRWSRHPNYFFEWLHWFAYVLIGIGSPYWWVTVAGVLVMYVFLTKVTGIPWTEQQSLRSRGDAYRRYQQSTSEFFPLPPRARVVHAAGNPD